MPPVLKIDPLSHLFVAVISLFSVVNLKDAFLRFFTFELSLRSLNPSILSTRTPLPAPSLLSTGGLCVCVQINGRHSRCARSQA